jgi:hypothetical protein
MRADLYHQKGHLKFSSSLLLLCKNISLFIIRYAEVVPVAGQPDPWIARAALCEFASDSDQRGTLFYWTCQSVGRQAHGEPGGGRPDRRSRWWVMRPDDSTLQKLHDKTAEEGGSIFGRDSYFELLHGYGPSVLLFFFHRLLLLTVQFSSWTTGTTENRKFTCLVLKLHHLSYTSFVYKRMQFSYFKESNRLNSN